MTRSRRSRLRWAVSALVAGLAAAPAAARDFEEVVPARPGGSLRVQLDAGSVEIESHAEESVRAEAWVAGLGSRSMRFDLSRQEDDVSLSGRSGGWLSLLGGPRVRVRVRVPQRFDVEVETRGGAVVVEDLVGEVSARTSGGRVSADRVAGDVELETSGGEVEASEIRGDVRVRTSGGPIRMTQIRGGIEAQTSGGSIRMRDVGGPVDARTSGGSIAVRFTRAPEGFLETSGGSISVEIPEGAGVELEAETSGGRVAVPDSTELVEARTDQRVMGTLGGGGDLLTLRTSGGNIRVRLR